MGAEHQQWRDEELDDALRQLQSAVGADYRTLDSAVVEVMRRLAAAEGRLAACRERCAVPDVCAVPSVLDGDGHD